MAMGTINFTHFLSENCQIAKQNATRNCVLQAEEAHRQDEEEVRRRQEQETQRWQRQVLASARKEAEERDKIRKREAREKVRYPPSEPQFVLYILREQSITSAWSAPDGCVPHRH